MTAMTAGFNQRFEASSSDGVKDGASSRETSGISEAALDETVASMGALSLKVKDLVLLLASLPEDERRLALEDESVLQAKAREELTRGALVSLAKQAGFDRRQEVAYHARRAAEQAIADLFLTSQAAPPADFPSEGLTRQAYEEEKHLYVVPERLRLSQIFLSAPASAEARAAVKAAAESLVADLTENAADFAALAQSRSDHGESAARGGDAGWAPVDELLPAVAQAAGLLQPGEISGVIETSPGFHIIKVTERRPAEPIPFDRARPTVAARLRKRRLEESREAILRRLLKETPPAADSEALARAARLLESFASARTSGA